MRGERQVLPGKTYLLTRRTLFRQFLFHPDSKLMNQIFWYCLAVAAERTGMEVHGAVALSNHPHLLVTDVHGRLPDFEEDLYKNLARCTNDMRNKRKGPVFDNSRDNSLELLTEAKVIEYAAYCVLNPVKAGLVKEPEQWPGVCVLPKQMGCLVIDAERPPVYFSRLTDMPKKVKLRITVPPCFADLTAPQWQKIVLDAVEEEKRQIHASFAAEGKGFIGPNRLLSNHAWTDVPTTPAGDSGRPPRWAGPPEARKRRRQEYNDFREANFAACNRFQRGAKTVFPMGSWWMKKRWGVTCVGDEGDGYSSPPACAEPETRAAA